MASEKGFFKKEFKSKTAVAKCGYCFNSFKEENFKKHCLTVHKKPKLVAGQKKIDGLFKKHLEASKDAQFQRERLIP